MWKGFFQVRCIRRDLFPKERVFAWREVDGLYLIFSQTSTMRPSATWRRVSIMTCASSAEYHTCINTAAASSGSRLNATKSRIALRSDKRNHRFGSGMPPYIR
jgi:hypothetical protein